MKTALFKAVFSRYSFSRPQLVVKLRWAATYVNKSVGLLKNDRFVIPDLILIFEICILIQDQVQEVDEIQRQKLTTRN